MSLPEIQQAIAVLNRSHTVALFVSEKPSVDSFSSMIALSLALQSNPNLIIHSISPTHVPEELQFLPGSSQVEMNIDAHPSLIIDIAGTAELGAITHEATKSGTRIHIALPKNSDIQKDFVETHIRQLPYDCIIIFGAGDIAELGPMYSQFADFFYNIPVINIDHKPTNEYFGTINMVDITASSIAEITHEFIATLSQDLIDEDVATALYAGIVGATESFQKPSTTPTAFQLAADLMNKHAQTDIVIQHLVKTKPLSLLKISGRTYARLRHDEHGHLFWSILRHLDFQESGASEEHIPLIMKELTNNISGYNVAFVLYENEQKEHSLYVVLGKGLVKKSKDIEEQLFAKRWRGILTIALPKSSLEDAEIEAVERIRKIIPNNHS